MSSSDGGELASKRVPGATSLGRFDSASKRGLKCPAVVALFVTAAIAVSGGGAHAEDGPTAGDDTRVARGFDELVNMRPASGIRALTGPLIDAMRGTAADKNKAARYLCLIGDGFGLDGNIRAYKQCAQLAFRLDPSDPDVLAFGIQANLRASTAFEARGLVALAEPFAEKNAYVARELSTWYRVNGEAKKANALLRTAISLNPDDPTLFSLAAKHLAKEPKDVAQYYHEAADKADKQAFRAQMYLWAEERALKKEKASTEHIDAAAKLLPDEASWKAQKAFYLLDRKQNADALKLFADAASSTNRLSTKSLSQFSLFCAYNGHPKTAIKAADRLVALEPDLAESYFSRANLYRQLGKQPSAQADYRKAIAVNPHFSQAYENLREYPEYISGANAEWLAREWTTNCPEKIDSWLFAGDAERKGGKYEQALTSYDTAERRLIAANKSATRGMYQACRAHAGHGASAYKLGRMAIAEEDARKFNNRKPDKAGELLRVRPARVNFAHYKTDQEQRAAMHAALADMLYESGDLDDCVKEYKTALASLDEPDWHRGLLKAYMDKGDYREALGEDITVSNNAVTRELPGAVADLRKQFGH